MMGPESAFYWVSLAVLAILFLVLVAVFTRTEIHRRKIKEDIKGVANKTGRYIERHLN